VLRASDGAVVERFPDMDTAQAGNGVIYLWSSQSNGPAPGVFAVRPYGKEALTRRWSSPDAVVQQVTGDVVFTSGGYVLRGSDGAQMCTFPPSKTVQRVVAGIAYLSDGNIITPSAPISAVDLRNGTVLWTFTAASAVLTVSGGIAFVSDSEADNPTIYALGAGDGRTLWTFRTASLGSPSLAVDRDVVYIGTGTSLAGIAKGSGGSVHALRVSDGEELWRFSAIGNAPASLATVPGSVYVCDGSLIGMGAGGGGRVTALRSRDGAGIWSFQPGGSNPQLVVTGSAMYMTVGSPFPAESGTSPDAAADSGVWALRPQSGARAWELTVPWPGQDSAPPLAVQRGMAYVGAGDGTVHALRS
jgi:outer membrane protein assembly factor BamB